MKKLKQKEMGLFLMSAAGLDLILSLLYWKSGNTFWLSVLMLTPTVCAIWAKRMTRDRSSLGLRIDLKKCGRDLVIAWFLPVLLGLIGTILYFLVFPHEFEPLKSAYAHQLGSMETTEYFRKLIPLWLAAAVINPVAGLLTCLGEELGWRGFLFCQLTKQMDARKAAVVSGAIWGVWHALIVGLTGWNYGREQPMLAIAAMILFCICIGIIQGWLFRRCQSVWGCVVFHAALNGMDKTAPANLLTAGNGNRFLGPNPVGLIGGVGFILLAWALWRKSEAYRERRNS